ncbi:MAG: hypothetical protein ACR2OR_17875 [Hyphomicrobiales bacterium]
MPFSSIRLIVPASALVLFAGFSAAALASGKGGPDSPDPLLDGHTKVEVHARYPGDNIKRGKYRNRHYYEHCGWRPLGQLWGGDRPLNLTMSCVRIEEPNDMGENRN